MNKEPKKGKLEKFKAINFNKLKLLRGASTNIKLPNKGNAETQASKLICIFIKKLN